MLLLGIGSKARQGKDLAAEAVRDHYERENRLKKEHGILRGPGTQVGIFKFATALYQEVNEAIKDGIWESRTIRYTEKLEPIAGVRSGGQCEHFLVLPAWVQSEPNPEISELAPYGKHPKLLQFWGTEYRRAQDPDYWVNKTFASIPANLDIAIITDVRFQNEARAVKQRGGHTLSVIRLREDGTPHLASDRPVDHPSETSLDNYNWDFKLVNSNGHQALLGEQTITLCEYLRGLHD